MRVVRLALTVRRVTGHSQGILTALVFAASKTEDELVENIVSSVQYLFWIGVRLQQAVTFPSFIEAQRTDILKESKKIHGSRNPTPMMVVIHLLPQIVQKYVDIINKKLSDEPNRQLEIALQVLCVVCGVWCGVVCVVCVAHKGWWCHRTALVPWWSWATRSRSTRSRC